ncbi:MAG: hypothetical protein AUK44_10435 [Porphyromonadaceae bacterium CG2_30_38_12]|nr:MAG: hypothetical protein AUK44_10435 [Porphyromonadaceae bacterium CG2_30_38_12]
MKKTTLLFVTAIFCSTFTFAQWAKMDLTLSGGGTISNAVNQLALDNGKLYAATADGIFESATANGADWTPFGLQGKRVFMMSFATQKFALTAETAADDATKKTLQLYKLNGANWELTNFNPTKLAVFGTALDNLINFAQINDGTNNVVVVPTWGNGIWRSTDGGANWTKSDYAACPDAAENALSYKKVPGIYSFPGDATLYGTDKPSGGSNGYQSNIQYVIYSEDFGATWKNLPVANFFNPWAFHKRKVGGETFFYWGGKDGNQGAIWRSGDAGLNWDASLTSGVEYWDNRRIIGEDDGPLYIMCSVNNVYVSTDNGDSFLLVGAGIVIPETKPAPAGEPFFLTNLIKSSSKLYLSTYNDGIYQFALAANALKNTKINNLEIYLNQDQSELAVNAEIGSQISIYSITGKLLKSVFSDNITSKMSINELSSSVYIVKAVTTDGTHSINRFIKK